MAIDKNQDLNRIKSSLMRDDIIKMFLENFNYELTLCNPYSYKLKFSPDYPHVMLYTSTLKIYDAWKGKTISFKSLSELEEYIDLCKQVSSYE